MCNVFDSYSVGSVSSHVQMPRHRVGPVTLPIYS
jgi:hypothetical protein